MTKSKIKKLQISFNLVDKIFYYENYFATFSTVWNQCKICRLWFQNWSLSPHKYRKKAFYEQF